MNTSRVFFKKLCFLAAMLPAIYLPGQGFLKHYPATGGDCKGLVQANDGGYVMAGSFLNGPVQKTDSSGNIIWTSVNAFSGGQGVAVTNSGTGDFYALGENYSDNTGLKKNIVAKIGSDGIKAWSIVIPNQYTLANGLKDLATTIDGGLVAAGNTRDSTLNQHAWLVKIDPTGAVVWNKMIGDSTREEQVSRIVALSDGSLMISGTVLNPANDRDFFLLKTDANGNRLWEKVYHKPGYQIAYDMLVTTGDNIVLLGVTEQTDPIKITLLKTNQAGEEILYKTLGIQTVLKYYTVGCFARDNADNLYIPVDGLVDLFTHQFLVKLDSNANAINYYSLAAADYPKRAILTADGQHIAIAGGDGTGAFLVKSDFFGIIYSNSISGIVYQDLNSNCQQDGNEGAYPGILVEARNQTGDAFFGAANQAGAYNLQVSTGDFKLIAHPSTFWAPCDTQIITVASTNQAKTAAPTGIKALGTCPYMEVYINPGSNLRRCSTTVYAVHYFNSGSVPATNAYVDVTFDPLLLYVSSTLPAITQSGNVYRFNIPDVPPLASSSFEVSMTLSCGAALGQTICASAHIYPDSTCLAPSPNWDNSVIQVTGTCNAPTGIEFNIKNIGIGDMQQQSDYVIIEDQIMLLGKFKLKSQHDTTILLPSPAGHSYFLRADQSSGNPNLTASSAIVQNCGGNSASNFYLQLPSDDGNRFLDIACDEVVGSFDPNDKRGFPQGWKSEHFIDRGQDIDYIIRFQNTGTDTAFSVMIRDTIDAQLDAGSLRPGPSSHPYTWEINAGRELTFHFPGIHLPDSTINEPGSHGFVQFKMKQKADLPDHTVIQNRAGIYFDFNKPVITNTTFHTIGQFKQITAVQDIQPGSLSIEVFPNPADRAVTFRLNDVNLNGPTTMTLYDLTGKTIRTVQFNGPEYQFDGLGLSSGIFMYRLLNLNGKTATGKLILR